VPGRGPGEDTRLAAATGAFICFEDEADRNLRPPKGRTSAPRGCTPGVTVSGKGSERLPVAGLGCFKPDCLGACSTWSVSTGDAKASAAACPKPITPA
jgi:hypothetical protein